MAESDLTREEYDEILRKADSSAPRCSRCKACPPWGWFGPTEFDLSVYGAHGLCVVCHRQGQREDDARAGEAIRKAERDADTEEVRAKRQAEREEAMRDDAGG
jgi:hypothetical protein